MAVQRTDIEQFLLLTEQHPVIDVRSPGEYNHAHLPGAHSLPLFTDEERKVVGTAYKQESRETAIKIGLDYFGPKMRKMVEEVETLLQKHSSADSVQDNRTILVYCWRGGMRSGAVAWLLDLYGFKVITLAGGYKKFRNYVLDTFRQPFGFNMLGGYTGSGKTALLKALEEKNEIVIDLEDIAKHKGSAFGNIGMPEQPTQEMFENLLAMALRRSIENSELAIEKQPDSPFPIAYSPIWLEDESQRIGHVNIPHELWLTMRNSPVWFLNIPFEERLRQIVQEYGSLDQERMIGAIERISRKLGDQHAKAAIALLKEGNTTESFSILLSYYDKFYLRSLHNRNDIHTLLQEVDCKSVTTENAEILLRKIQLSSESPSA